MNKEKMTLGPSPAVLLYKGSIKKATDKGCVFFYHGLFASKEKQEKELLSLADNGFLAVGIDNVGHGERLYDDFDWRFSSANPNFEEDFIKAVYLTAGELSHVIDSLALKSLIDVTKIGVTGISMGGYITYSALLAEPRIKAAVSILGSPKWKIESPGNPYYHPDKIFPRALLSQNAGLDKSVPAHYAREFHIALKGYYTQSPDRQKYMEYPESGHFMTESDWNICWQKSIEWFETYLRT